MSTQSSTPTPSVADVAAALADAVTSGTKQLETFGRAAQPVLEAYVSLLRTATALSTSTATSITSALAPATAALSSAVMSSAAQPSKSCGCDIPETSCPPYCVCELVLDGSAGERVHGTITLTNTRKTAQTFVLAAKPFHGTAGVTTHAPALTVPHAALEAGQSETIGVSFTVPAAFGAGEVYTADITIAGLYEQCVRVTLRTRSRPHCDVKQGEIPRHITAHRWYDHFQCEELCFEPVVRRAPIDIGNVDVTPTTTKTVVGT